MHHPTIHIPMGGKNMLDLTGYPDAMAAFCIEKELHEAGISAFTAYPGVHAKVQGARLGAMWFGNEMIVGFTRRSTHWRVRFLGIALSSDQKELFYGIIRNVGMPDILPNRLRSDTEEDGLAMWAVKKLAGLKTLACNLQRTFGEKLESNSTIEECAINSFGWSLFPPDGHAEEQTRVSNVHTTTAGNTVLQWMLCNKRIPLVADEGGLRAVILPADVRNHTRKLRDILSLRKKGMYKPRREGVVSYIPEAVRIYGNVRRVYSGQFPYWESVQFPDDAHNADPNWVAKEEQLLDEWESNFI